MRLFKWGFILCLLLGCQLSYAADTEIASDVMKIKAVRINDTLTHDNSTELFMDLQNTGMVPHTLIAAYSPIAKQTQMHQTIEHGKQASMSKVNSIPVPPHKDEDLHFGGLHLMLMGLEKSIENHESIPITLIFDDGSWLTVDAQVFTAPPTT